MKKTKPIRSALTLLMILLLSTLVSAHLPILATASPGEIEFMSIWTGPEELAYWDTVIAAFEADTLENPTGITINHRPVEMDAIFDEIIRRNTLGTDPDVICMHAMWLPRFASGYAAGRSVVPIVAEAPDDVAMEVTYANYVPSTVDGSTYKGIVYGYPFEFNSHALVYNKERLKAGTGSDAPPTTWDELKTKARACTVRDGTGAITKPGFMPYIDGNEEKRYEFMNFLWSNGGEFLDLTGDDTMGTAPFGTPEALFNTQAGVDVLQLFEELNDKEHPGTGSYNPDTLPDIYGLGWAEESIAMVVIPGWFTYVRAAMGANFNHLGIAPVPIGPQIGATSACVVYNWMLAVTQKSKNDGRADDAWTFLKWLNKPRNAGYIGGTIPRGGPCSIVGDWLIYDSILPSRLDDQANGKTTDGKLLKDDFWFKGFIDQANLYGRPDKAFAKSEEVQDIVGVMFEQVASYGYDPATTIATAAADVNLILPIPGDINLDGDVSVADATFVVKDWDAEPGWPNWNRGRADVDDDGKVTGLDGGLIVINW